MATLYERLTGIDLAKRSPLLVTEVADALQIAHADSMEYQTEADLKRRFGIA